MTPELWFFKLKILLLSSNTLFLTYFSPYYGDQAVCEGAARIRELPIEIIATLQAEQEYRIEGGDLCWQGPVEAWDFEHGWADNATEESQ